MECSIISFLFSRSSSRNKKDDFYIFLIHWSSISSFWWFIIDIHSLPYSCHVIFELFSNQSTILVFVTFVKHFFVMRLKSKVKINLKSQKDNFFAIFFSNNFWVFFLQFYLRFFSSPFFFDYFRQFFNLFLWNFGGFFV